MKNDLYDKWNQYKIGEIGFINKRKDHPHRKIFVDCVVNECSSVIEIGPGELVEYQRIVQVLPDIDYAICDVSDLFINNCHEQYPNVTTIKAPMETVHKEVSQKYDIVYGASVLEHSSNVSAAIKSMISVAKRFHFVLFKWRFKGNLKSTIYPKRSSASYHTRPHFYSSIFDVWKLIKEIERYGEIDRCDLIKQDGTIEDFRVYGKGKSGEHRDGNYLMITGKNKEGVKNDV